MSSKSKNLRAFASSREPQNEEAKPALVPQLRFPEFRNAEAWASEPMGEVYSFKGNNSLSRDKLNYVAGSVKNIHYGDIHTKFSSHFDITKELVPFINESEVSVVRNENLCVEGDMIFADASEDMADIGKCIEIVRLNGERLVSGLHTILARRAGGRIALGFGGHLFKSGLVRAQIQREAQGAKVLGISANRMRNLRLPLPRSTAEQQKIAECLSSVDELMAAQARKVDALKTHKKGLMQQLFPREGETQPRLRFPEFQNAGEWEARKLGDFADVSASGDLDTATFSPEHSEIHCFPIYSNAVENEGVYGYSSVAKHQANSVTITARGTLGKAFLRTTGFVGIGRLIVVTNFIGVVDPRFLRECWDHLAVIPQEVTSIPQLTAVAARATILPFPSLPEQQRIATCLSSLDALITAETQKLEALKTHKKGLMQQLFPSPEELS